MFESNVGRSAVEVLPTDFACRAGQKAAAENRDKKGFAVQMSIIGQKRRTAAGRV
jgi:hypothetical protein